MDAEITTPALNAGTNNQPPAALSPHATGATELGGHDLRRVRVALGEYARRTGMHDPVDILDFTRLCISTAADRLGGAGQSDVDALLRESLRIAAESCGVSKAGSCDVRLARELNRAALPTVAPVPQLRERAMPAQPLGELPDLRPAHIWTSLMQGTLRGVATMLSSVFVRSER